MYRPPPPATCTHQSSAPSKHTLKSSSPLSINAIPPKDVEMVSSPTFSINALLGSSYKSSNTSSVFSSSPSTSPSTFSSPLSLHHSDPSPASQCPPPQCPTSSKAALIWKNVSCIPSTIAPLEMFNSIEDSVIDARFADDLKLEKPLGAGSFSTVFNCSSHGHCFAIKIPKSTRTSKQIFKEILNFNVISSRTQLNNFNQDESPFLNVYGFVFLDKSKYSRIKHGENLPCLVSSRLSLSLEALISQLRSLPASSTPSSLPSPSPSSSPDQYDLHIGTKLWWKLAHQLTLGLVLLKNCSMIHLDLKTSNILYDSHKQNFKIADFTSAGLFADIQDQYLTLLKNGSYFDITMQYCAPEMIQAPPSIPTYQTDLYAAGMVLLAAAVGEEPYNDYLKCSNSSHSYILLNECIKKNKVIDLLSPHKRNILQKNKSAYDLIKIILIDRVHLEDVVSFMNNAPLPTL